MNTYADKSLASALADCAKRADGRDSKKVSHSFEAILILMTLGFLMGVTGYRGVYNFFNPVGIFYEPKKSGGNGKGNGNGKKKKASRMSAQEKKTWQNERAAAMAVAAQESEDILRELRKNFPCIKDIPHYSTFSRAFNVADARELVCSLYFLFLQMIPEEEQRHIAIDGKALRAALNKALENHSLYIVNVFDTAARIFLVSFMVQDKKNEGSTIMKELDNILLGKPSIVTMDAAGTQTELIRRIHSLGSQYVLPVKSNQKNLKTLIRGFCEGQAQNSTESASYAVDILGHTADENPSQTIKPSVIRITEELNGKAGRYVQMDKEEEENRQTEESMAVSDEIMEQDTPVSQKGGKEPVCDTDDTKEGSVSVDDLDDGLDGEDGAEPDIVVPVKGIPFEDLGKLYPCFIEQFPFLPKEELKLDKNNKSLIAVEIDGNCILMGRNADRFERTEVISWSNPKILEERLFERRFETVSSIILVNRYRLERRFTKELGKHWELTINSTPYISNGSFSAERSLEIIKGHWGVEERHKTLDVIMLEDYCTTKGQNGPWALSILREAAINLFSYFGGKWAVSAEEDLSHTEGMYEVRNYTKNRISAAISWMKKELSLAEDVD